MPWFIFFINILGKRNIKLKYILLFLANSLFYIWGGITAFFCLCIYCILTWFFAFCNSRLKNKLLLAVTIAISTIPLLTVKYLNFFIENLINIVGKQPLYLNILIPMGISFFTFEAISLIVYTYRNNNKAPTLLNVFLYLSFFPVITSGPILRYKDFEENLKTANKEINYSHSINRIIFGLFKKIIIADKIAIIANFYFDGLLDNNFSCLGLWIGSIAYTLQLYFDFSGYSDIAIGIGNLMGFKIEENFNNPYRAYSISEFWKRWHMTLTKWFKDYIYIPLGGNRCSTIRTVFNMMIVWLITGFWHGANWSFIIWGLGYFILLVFEKYIVKEKIKNTFFGHLYTLFFVNILWIPFRSDNIKNALIYIKGMFNFTNLDILIESKAIRYIPLLLFAILLCLPWDNIFSKYKNNKWVSILKGLSTILIAFIVICALANSTYAPYIYGNF